MLKSNKIQGLWQTTCLVFLLRKLGSALPCSGARDQRGVWPDTALGVLPLPLSPPTHHTMYPQGVRLCCRPWPLPPPHTAYFLPILCSPGPMAPFSLSPTRGLERGWGARGEVGAFSSRVSAPWAPGERESEPPVYILLFKSLFGS